MEQKPIFGALRAYRERGAFLLRLEQHAKAKAAYDEAYKYGPEDVRLLVGRSRAYTEAMRPRQAFADAERALLAQPDSVLAASVQACAMYAMNEFERSLVMNYRGYRLREQPPYFKEGINQALETIQDCIGTNAGDFIKNNATLIKKHRVVVNPVDPPKAKHISRIPKSKATKYYSEEVKRPTKLSRVLAMKYLGTMANDKFFLEELKQSKEVTSANVAGSQELLRLIDETYATICERQEMLRVQCPYYTIKNTETISKYMSKHRKESLEKERRVNTKIGERFIKKMGMYKYETKIQDMVKTAERFQIFMDTKNKQNFPDKVIFTDRMYRLIAEGFLTMYRLSLQLSDSGNYQRIVFLMGVPIKLSGFRDTVINNYPTRYGDKNMILRKLMTELENSAMKIRKCYLCYEISVVLMALRNYPLARHYAKRCQIMAEEIDCEAWWVNGSLAMIRGDVQQANVHDVLLQADETLARHRQLSPDNVHFLKKLVEVLNDIFTCVTEEDSAARRESDILKVMDEQTRSEAQYLFKRIAHVPEGRRFCVMPRGRGAGAGAGAETPPVRRRCRQGGLSVVPGRDRGVPPLPPSHAKGWLNFNY